MLHWNSEHSTVGETWYDSTGAFSDIKKDYIIAPNTGKGKTPGDLNSNADGAFLYLYYTKSFSGFDDNKALSASGIYGVVSDTQTTTSTNIVPGFRGHIYTTANDLNSEAGGKYIYLFASMLTHAHEYSYKNTSAESHLTRCTLCGAQEYQEHSSADGVRINYVEPTCTDYGAYDLEFRCKQCNRVLNVSTGYRWKLPTGHNTVEVPYKAPTCTEDGYSSHWKCINPNCGKLFYVSFDTQTPVSFQEFVLPAWHSTTRDVAMIPATCTYSGYTAGVFCGTCLTYISGHDELPALEHSYTGAVKSNGNSTHSFRCVNGCGNYGAPVGCDYNSGVVTVAPGCTSTGMKTYTCTVCNSTKKEVLQSTGHTFSTSWATDTEPTCTQPGSKSHHCTQCDEKTDITAIPPTGHSEETLAGVNPTCTETGLSAGVRCSVCKELLTAQLLIDALGHNYREDPKGSGKMVCTLCNDTYIKAPAFEPGKIDEDERISAADARLALRFAVGLDTPTEKQRLAADINNDGKLTSADARLILRAAVGLEKALSIYRK